MDKKTETEETDSDSKKQKIDTAMNKLVSFRPAGIFGFVAIMGAFYVYRNIQVWSI
ncbi:hypothetical protein GOV12_02145 [Candidatus Pacearchaeota archaeon]|nr:hypothetical protein [Candidatus Pacearchaeota archaeon]